MSTFRTTVQAMLDKDVYLMNSGTPLKAKIVQINDDLVVLDPDAPNVNYKIVMHIDSVMLAIA
jgi:hypothetical protein